MSLHDTGDIDTRKPAPHPAIACLIVFVFVLVIGTPMYVKFFANHVLGLCFCYYSMSKIHYSLNSTIDSLCYIRSIGGLDTQNHLSQNEDLTRTKVLRMSLYEGKETPSGDYAKTAMVARKQTKIAISRRLCARFAFRT